MNVRVSEMGAQKMQTMGIGASSESLTMAAAQISEYRLEIS